MAQGMMIPKYYIVNNCGWKRDLPVARFRIRVDSKTDYISSLDLFRREVLQVVLHPGVQTFIFKLILHYVLDRHWTRHVL